ncbi:hypothetical protein WA171_006569, partial [Blastocystis sp. BT1]
SVKSIVIQREVGNEKESFTLSDFPSLISIEIGYKAFNDCHSIVFENLTQLQSITLEYGALCGYECKPKSHMYRPNPYSSYLNRLEMNNLPSLSTFKGEGYNFIRIGKVTLNNIPSLTSEGIQMREDVFREVKELYSSNADSLDRFIEQRKLHDPIINHLDHVINPVVYSVINPVDPPLDVTDYPQK